MEASDGSHTGCVTSQQLDDQDLYFNLYLPFYNLVKISNVSEILHNKLWKFNSIKNFQTTCYIPEEQEEKKRGESESDVEMSPPEAPIDGGIEVKHAHRETLSLFLK